MYLLTEQIFNGTVTMQIISTGIIASNWEEAKEKVKSMRNMTLAQIQSDNDEEITYSIQQKFPCYGRMENKSLNII